MRNNGIVEYWNVGLRGTQKKEFDLFMVLSHYSNIPPFQSSLSTNGFCPLTNSLRPFPLTINDSVAQWPHDGEAWWPKSPSALCPPKFAIRNSQFEILSSALCYAELAVPATLRVATLVWSSETGSISIFDLLGVNVRRNAFPTDPATKIFWGLIHDPGPVTLHANVSHFSISPLNPPCIPSWRGGNEGIQGDFGVTAQTNQRSRVTAHPLLLKAYHSEQNTCQGWGEIISTTYIPKTLQTRCKQSAVLLNKIPPFQITYDCWMRDNIWYSIPSKKYLIFNSLWFNLKTKRERILN